MSKIALSGNASGTGTFTIASPNSNSNYQLDLPAESGTIVTGVSGLNATNLTSGTIPKARMYAGAVLQVVSTTKLDSFSSTSGTMVDITGLSLSITPSSASSKILIFASLVVSSDSWSTGGMTVNLVRDSTNLARGTGGSSINSTSGYNAYSSSAGNTYGNFSPMAISFLDSPSSTSALTYKLQGATNAGGFTWTVNRRMQDAAYGFSSTITALEIAG